MNRYDLSTTPLRQMMHSCSKRMVLILLTLVVCAICMTCTSDHDEGVSFEVPLQFNHAPPQPPVSHEDLPASEWIRFVSPDRDFEVALPTVPVQFADSVKTPIGMQPVTRFKAAAAGCEFDAGFLQRSANVLARFVGQESILESACEGTAEHMGGKVVDSSTLALDGQPARDIRIQFDGERKSLAMARLMITDDRIYHAIVRMPADSSATQQSNAHRFLDSLHLEHPEAVASR